MKEDLIESIDYKDYTIEVYPDFDPMDPRDWDNLGTLALWHRRYNLANEDNLTIEEFNDMVKEEGNNLIMLQVNAYDHGNLTLTADPIQGHRYPYNDPWDSGVAGFIFVSKDKIRKEYGWKRITQTRRARIVKYLINEVQTYSYYLSGPVYGYVILDPQGNDLDSCWGYYGHDGYDYMIEECKGLIDDSVIRRSQRLTIARAHGEMIPCSA